MACIVAFALVLLFAQALCCGFAAERTNAIVVEIEGKAVVARAGSDLWNPAVTNGMLFSGDRFRTLERSRAVIRLSELSLLRLGELSHIQIPEPTVRRGGLQLFRGLLYYFHRDKPGVMPLSTPSAYAVILGTEFTVVVDEDGAARLTLIDGTVEMTNNFGRVNLVSGESAISELNKAPIKAPALEIPAAMQWILYYPAVLDLADIDLGAGAEQTLKDSLSAYRQGDLSAALAALPGGYRPASDAEKIYTASLLLSVGKVEDAKELLADIDFQTATQSAFVAGALRRLIALVASNDATVKNVPRRATEWLVESYARQARFDLTGSLDAARQATILSPNFAFAWARVAELEFSFGRTQPAREAAERSLQLAPRNAQAVALKGFLLAAENRIVEAIDTFSQAIALDGALGNAWLGRGLCRIRRGEREAGRDDLQVAATLEPQRAVLRSDLAKAFGDAGDRARAAHELKLAKALDPNDPTAWLYSALLNQQQNRINAGVKDLERSKALNDNRSVFRSRELLDQDRAVRSANLAALYRDAGMSEVGAREAASAVDDDYANHSAHLFLANSFNALRDPNLVNLRYETATFSEYLVANLLAPVGGTLLSPRVSQQEYSRLFERDRLGISSETEYTSDGSWAQSGSQYGVAGNVSYAVDADWRSRAGQRSNNDLDQFIGGAHAKAQLTPQDSIYFLASYADVNSGDVRQFYDERQASRGLRVTERQEPNVFAGYHHEWAPGMHTLFLAARLNDTLLVREPRASIRTLVRDDQGTLTGQVNPADSVFDLDYRSELNAWSAELQQIAQSQHHLLLAGIRYQAGEVETRSVLDRDPQAFPPVFNDPAAAQRFTPELERANAYAYWQWQIFDPLRLIAGVSYDWLRFPENIDAPPITSQELTHSRISPKAGFLWTPFPEMKVRGAYTRSLGGVFFDNSVRLEPTQLGGFIQSFRSLIPESVAGSVPGTRFETFHLGVERKFPTRTYVVGEAELLRSEARRAVGIFDYTDAPPFIAVPSTVGQELEFEERTLALTVNQLVGEEWAFGVRYRISDAELNTRIRALPLSIDPSARTDERATLHQLNLFAIYQHASGFFARGEVLWRAQDNRGDGGLMPGDDFWQFNAWAGWRFAERRAEIALGLLNLGDQNYRLNPLNLTSDLPRERTFVANFKFNF